MIIELFTRDTTSLQGAEQAGFSRNLNLVSDVISRLNGSPGSGRRTECLVDGLVKDFRSESRESSNEILHTWPGATEGTGWVFSQ